MKTKIGADEWYPVISLNDWGTEIEVSDELFNKHKKIMEEFNELQSELYKIYKDLK